MNLRKRFKYFVASLLMVASTIAPLGNGLIHSAYADSDPDDAPVRSKTLTDNGDGTYTLTLSVTGKSSSSDASEKANVVVVFDSSGSMDYSTTANRYEVATYGRYGKIANDYIQLYRWSNWYGDYVEVGDNDNHTDVYYYDEGEYVQYTDTRYRQTALNRLTVAKNAVNGLAEKLLENNTTSGVSDMVEMAFVDFATNVKSETTHATKTTSIDTFKSWVNATSADGGTNWEDALNYAKSINFNDNDPVYIVFVSDGNPTFRVSKYNNNANDGRNCSGYGSNATCARYGTGNSDPNGWNLAAAQDVAATITADANNTLYAVGVFGDANNMRNLDSKAIYKDATDQAALEAAFDDIVKQITNNLSLTGLSFNDGITALTSVSIDGTADDFTYKKNGTVWADAPEAKFENGTVTWDLGNTILGDGETATVSFIVYPSQESIDLVADLNNGVIKYENLTADQKSQILVSGETYTLKTNTDYPTLKYQTVTTTTVNGVPTTTISDPKFARIDQPDPVELYTEEIALRKLWEDSLDPSQRENEVEDIYLQLYVDGKEYDKLPEYTENGIKIEKQNNSNVWGTGTIFIAPGLMVSEGHPAYTENTPYGVVTMNGKKYAVLNPGHEYKFGEKDINNHFELTNYIYHPMLVDGALMNVTFTKSGDTFTGVESAKPMSTISATNTIKGGINIEKKVVDKNGNEITDVQDKFNVKAHLQNPDGSDYHYDYRIYYGKNNPEYENCSDKTKCRSEHIYGDGVIDAQVYVGDVIRVVNVDTGTLYYVEENNIPAGYSLKETGYTISYGADAAKDDIAEKTENNIKWYAVKGNSASTATIVNTYVSGNLKLSKSVVVESGNADTAKAKAFDFTVKLYVDRSKTNELTSSYKIADSNKTIKSGDTVSLKDGESLTILDLPVGAYYEITESNAAGYVATKSGDTGIIADGETAEAKFTNTYNVSGKVTIKAKKDFNDWQAGESFLFKLNGDGLEKEMNASVRKGEEAEFEVEIKNIGTYNYTISEDLTNLRGGVTKTSGDINVTVVATDNGDGTLSFTTAYAGGEGEEKNTIVNQYRASGKIRLGASKILTGRDWRQGELYTFTVFDNEGKELDSRTDIGANGKYEFDEITYKTEDAGKTFVYVIRETSTLPGGVTNSGDITATVTVTDNHDGTLKTTVVYTGGQGEEYNTIVNTYSATGEYAFEIEKELTGRDWQDGESYSFALRDATGATLDTQTISRDGKVSFKALKFTQADAGEHKYVISETGNLPSGMSNSGDVEVTLNVTDDKAGKLGFEASYTKGAKIINTYEASGEVTLEATKVLDGRDWRDGESFEFELSGDGIDAQKIVVTEEKPTAQFDKISYDESDAGKTYTYTIKETTDLTGMGMSYSGDITVTVELTDDGEGSIVPKVTYSKEDKVIKNIYSASGDVTLSIEKKLEGRDWREDESYEFALKDADGHVIDTQTISKDGTVTFKKIDYAKIGTYNYTIEETTEMSNGMSNSGAINVSVEVTDNYDGTLTATPTYKDNNKTIVNTYSASGKAQLEATKALVGRDWKDGESFTFELFKGEESLGRKTVTKDNPKAIFDEIQYSEADIDAEYVYTIKEVGTLPSSMTSSGDLTVYVNVSDNGDGTLNAVTDYINGGTITNTYEANGKAQLGVTKELVGRDWLDSDEFTFELSGEGIETQTKTVKKGEEKAIFDEIQYSEANAGKTYTYTIKETTDLSGLSMTNSGEVTATVKVTDDGEGNLETEVSYTNSGKITNTYTAKGEVELQAAKELVGRDWLEGESYDFVLSGKDGEIDRQSVDSNENVTFKKINYTEADAGKTYTYTITEAGELKAGITKSGDISVIVKLTDDHKGKINAEVSYTDDGKIVNTYETKPVEVEKPFTVKKKINDQSNSKKDASFKFELLDDKNAVVQTKEVSTKDLVGSVDFDAIKFDKAGTYKYTLVETNDGQAGFSYDTAKHAVVIEVTDDYEKAQLVAKVTIDGKEVSEVEFVNTYKAEDTSTKINLGKVLNGIDQNLAKEFEFVLSDKDGEIQTVKIKGSGKAEFDEIKFEKVGEYTYTVKEVKGNAKGYTYDESEYTVTVNVSDEDAKLKAEISYKKDGAEADAIIFENSYKPEDVIYGCVECEVPIEAKKVFENRDLKDGEFEFEVYLDDELVATGHNMADGTIVLDEGIVLDKVGTYNFVIKEKVEEREEYVIYDENEYAFTVEVEDNGEGALEIVSDTSGEVVFTNKYDKPGKGGNVTPKPPVTNDSILSSVAMFVVSLIGAIGGVLFAKKSLKEEA